MLRKWLFLIIPIFIFYLFIFSKLSKTQPPIQFAIAEEIRVNLSKVVVHLDLKGAPPTLKYLEAVLRKIKGLGANGLLIEYEDMFPYEGMVANLSTPLCYNRKELREFLILAHKLDFEVIPLIQTFGHMEFALKLAEFEGLRENVASPAYICPNKNGSLNLIREMLKQIIEFHQSIAPLKHIHIGCDEVFEINKCPDCEQRHLNKMQIYFGHINSVVGEIKKMNPDTAVLIWDDMLQEMTPLSWYGVRIPQNLEAVSWDYRAHLTINNAYIQHYHTYFSNIWIASAFKGADGSQAVIPNIKNRVLNNLNWIYFIHDYKHPDEAKVHTFKGIILTGWSRYSHFQPLCETLPVSLSSLILNLLFISRFKNGGKFYGGDIMAAYQKDVIREFRREIECEFSEGMTKADLYDFNECYLNLTFPLYNVIRSFTYFANNIVSDYKEKEIEMYHKFGSLLQNELVEKRLTYTWCNTSMETLKHLEKELEKRLKQFFNKNVCNELIGFKSAMAYKYLNSCIKKLSFKQKYLGTRKK